MTRDDIRKLIGGYATGSLTETERKVLFEAALDDQELFDELAREQSIKELLDEPGARERLIAALDSHTPGRAWWKRPWPWAAAVGLSLGIAALVSVVPHQRSKPLEVALAPEPSPALAIPAGNAPVAKSPARPISAPVKEKKAERRDEPSEDRKVKPEAPAAAPAAIAIGTGAVPQPAPPAQQAPTPSPRVQQQALDTAQRETRAQVGVAMKTAPFAFAYNVEPGGYVTITVAGDGYLRVETPTPALIANDLPVANGSTTRLKIPDGAQELTITFAASLPGAENALAGSKSSPQRGKVGLGGRVADRLFVKKDERSGTIEDPNPSPNSRLVVTVPLH